MEQHHEVLDDFNIQNKAFAALEKELQGLKFWLLFSAIIMLIIGIIGVGFVFFFFRDTNWTNFLLGTGMGIAFLIALPMAFQHYQFGKKISAFCQQETDNSFENLASSTAKSWRLLAFAFLFSGFASAQFLALEAYYDYSNSRAYEQYDASTDPVEPSFQENPENEWEAPVEETDAAPEEE